MRTLLLILLAAAPALVFLALPFLASTVGAVFCAAVHRALKRGPPIGQPAGPWLEDRITQAGFHRRHVGPAGLEVGIAPTIAGSADGFWPTLGYIGLAPRTWVDRTLAGRTIAAHELGHALLWMQQTTLARRLAWCRRIAEVAFIGAGAGFLVGGMLDHRPSIALGFLALVLGLVTQIGVLYDEANASWTGRAILDAEGLRTPLTDLAMLAAFLVYAIPFLLRSLFLFAAPGFIAALLASPAAQASNSPLALWAVLLLFPILILRTLQVAMEVHEPPRRSNTFQLNWTLYREHAWAFHSGSIVLLWLALSHDEPLSAGLEWGFLLAILPAMRPLGGLGRLVVLAPLLTVLSLVGFTQPVERLRAPAEPDPMRFLPDQDHLLARIGGLVRIAWLPLALVLVRRALSGW